MDWSSSWAWLFLPAAIFLLTAKLPWLLKRLSKGRPVNPVDEANVYLAYGRKEQALGILRDALAIDPKNEEVVTKLREIERK